jgi:TonB family protein
VIPGDPTNGIGLPGGGLFPAAQVFTESDVDDLPSLIAPGRLRYPPVLAEAGIDGAVTLTFVIDTAGKIDPSGMEIVSATHPGFIEAAKEVVSTSRFRPARKHGTPVRVRVRQTITFRN